MSVAFVQGNIGQYAQSSSAQTLAFTSNVTGGNCLIVCVTSYFYSTSSVSDNLNGSYTNAVMSSGSYSLYTSIWYFANCAGGSCTVSVTPAVNNPAVVIGLHEYSGIVASAPLRTTATNTSISTNGTTGSIAATAGDLMVACCGVAETTESSLAVASPFVSRNVALPNSSRSGLITADDIGAAGSANASFTLSSAYIWAATGAAFIPASGGGGGSQVFMGWLPRYGRTGRPGRRRHRPVVNYG